MYPLTNLAAVLVTLSLGFNMVDAAATRMPSSRSADADGTLEARGPNEALYLTNCQYTVSSGYGTYSQMAYYSNGRTGSQHGEQPDNTASFNKIVTWEGQPQTANFQNNGGSATSNIVSGAQNYNVGQWAGTARNSYGQNFNCYRDNNRQLWSTTLPNHEGGSSCNSIYYCYDA